MPCKERPCSGGDGVESDGDDDDDDDSANDGPRSKFVRRTVSALPCYLLRTCSSIYMM